MSLEKEHLKRIADEWVSDNAHGGRSMEDIVRGLGGEILEGGQQGTLVIQGERRFKLLVPSEIGQDADSKEDMIQKAVAYYFLHYVGNAQTGAMRVDLSKDAHQMDLKEMQADILGQYIGQARRKQSLEMFAPNR